MSAPEPGWFRGRFGWLHRATKPNGVGLVIVPPFGYEAICAHRSLRGLAVAAVAAGITAVRFDLDGTGDSAGDDLAPHRVEAWLASISDACDVARTAGADRLVLVGVRLGAGLAALAAVKRTDVAGVVTIAAVPSGKALVREGRALQMALGLPEAPRTAVVPAEPEVVGFAQTAETRDALSQIDLARLVRAPANAMLVIDRDDLPPNDAWVASLQALGASVTHTRLSGYVEMMLDPHRVVVPHTIVEATVAFAARRPKLAHTSVEKLRLAPRVELGGGVIEEAVVIDHHVFAIATHKTTVPKRAVILLNSGAIHHVGPNRLYVAVARKLAADAALVLRVDLSGLGDGATRDGAADNMVYGDHAIADVAAAVAWTRRQGATKVAVAGVCSGAYHALKVALGDAKIDTIIPINPLTFFWKPDMPLDFAAFKVTADAERYKGAVRSVDSWKKLLRGEVDVRRVARVVTERARSAVEHRGRDVLRNLRVKLPDDLGTELLALDRKGVAIRFVFAASDPGRAMLLEQGGSAVPRLERSGALRIEVLDGPDHTFTPRWSHALFIDTIARALS